MSDERPQRPPARRPMPSDPTSGDEAKGWPKWVGALFVGAALALVVAALLREPRQDGNVASEEEKRQEDGQQGKEESQPEPDNSPDLPVDDETREIIEREVEWINNMKVEVRDGVVFAVNSKRTDRFPPEVREKLLARLEPFLSVEGNSFREHGWLLEDHADGRYFVTFKATMTPANGQENTFMELLAIDPNTLKYVKLAAIQPGELYEIYDMRFRKAREFASRNK